MPAFRTDFCPDVTEIAKTLDSDGFVCLENVVSPDWLERARAEVDQRMTEHGERFFTIVRPADEQGSCADAFVHDPQIVRLTRQLTELACPQGVIEHEDMYNVLRIIAGPKGSNGSLEFHYDASVVTMLVPLYMPSDNIEKSGALVTIPNCRPYRKTVGYNVAEKIFTQNNFYRKHVAKKILAAPDKFAQRLHPGNVYLFWGYRTYHGNLPCAPNSKRATLLIHYGNPHGNSATLHLVRNCRRAFEVAKLKMGRS